MFIISEIKRILHWFHLTFYPKSLNTVISQLLCFSMFSYLYIYKLLYFILHSFCTFPYFSFDLYHRQNSTMFCIFTMVLKFYGNTEMGVHWLCDVGCLICLRHLLRSRAFKNWIFSPKRRKNMMFGYFYPVGPLQNL